MEVRDDGASFLPLFLFFEVRNAVWDGEILPESPFVFGTQAGGDGGREVVVDIGGVEVWKGFEKFWSLPGVERSCEILAWTEDAERL